MSADTLRRAADLMRERAEAATPGPWGFGGSGVGTLYIDGDLGGTWRYQETPEHPHRAICRTDVVSKDETFLDSLRQSRRNGEHIAAWHPTVALAVADWIDTQARDLASADGHLPFCDSPGDVDHALDVARAYLNEEATR